MKFFSWLVAKVPHEKLKAFLTKYIEDNRETIKAALKKGGLALFNLLRKIVTNLIFG